MRVNDVMVVWRNSLYVLKDISLVRYGREWSSGEALQDHIFIGVADGWGELDSEKGPISLQYGNSVHISPGYAATIRSLKGHYPLQAYRIVFEKLELMETSDAHRMFRKTGNSGPDVLKTSVDAPQRQLHLLQKLEQHWSAERVRDQQAMQELFRVLLSELDDGRSVHSDSISEDKLSTTISYLRKHYASRLARDDAAQRIGMNPDYFSVWFKRATGRGFSAYVNGLRLEHAKRLLLSPGRSIQEVAEQVGYGDAFYFSRKFKEMTGEAPSVFAARPKRIAALQHAGHLLALGIKPVGAAETYLSRWGGASREMAGIAVIGEPFREEEIAALRPDLIIGHQYLGSELERKLRGISTTVIIPYNQNGPFEVLYGIAELLGKRTDADAFSKRYRDHAEHIRSQLGTVVQQGETVAYMEFRPPFVWLMCEANGRGIYNLYHALGFAAPPALKRNVLDKGKPLRIELSQLPEYAADHMLVGVYDPAYSEAEPYSLRELLAHPAWRELSAAGKRLHLVDLNAFAASDTTSLYLQLQMQADHLAGRI